MARAKGIQQHNVFKLGKRSARPDARNLRFKQLLRSPLALALPTEYDFDMKHSGIPTPMFANDRWGNCVIAGRAHQTLRFEVIEQNTVLSISDGDVIDQYFLESGGQDNGLIVLDSLKRWRNEGWIAAGQTLQIKAFAELDQTDPEEIRQSIFMDVGVGLGLLLPKSAKRQMDVGKPWDVVAGPDGVPNSWGGHYVYVSGYTTVGPVCITWGRKQQMTWAFVQAYCDEAYATFDDLNKKKLRMGLQVKAIERFIETNPPHRRTESSRN